MPESQREPYGALIEVNPSTALRLRVYPPLEPNGRQPVILVHGLLSSSDIFDLPGVPEASLARYLQQRGFHVVSFDQRGAGGSTTGSWAFGLKELVTEDLMTVIAWTLQTFRCEKVILGSHSLGGLEVYLLRAFLSQAGQAGGVTEAHLGDTFAVASPASFTRHLTPWNLVVRRGALFVARTDQSGDGAIGPAEYAWGLIDLSLPRLTARISARRVACILDGLKPRRFITALSSFLPSVLPIYNARDFRWMVLPNVLNSRILEYGSRQLLEELGHAIGTGGEIADFGDGHKLKIPEALKTVAPFRLLTISSSGDRMIPEEDVKTAGQTLPGVEHINTEQRFGVRSGHAGYLYKPALYPRVYEAINRFIGGAS